MTEAVVKLNNPVAGLFSRKQVRSEASVVVTVGATFKAIVASLLSQRTCEGSLITTDTLVSVLY
ncbi:hypothetical protein [Chryseobacterium sp.]|uniref:hypothetical protein n=1 Tax=Chryseobacterium sp. TaxID=1871047 RepID=UPI0035C74412